MKTEDIKKMGLAYVQVLEAGKKNKHGHDAVGHEDGDIDNDGDKDKSDSYLHNRRKAISANMKTEELHGNQHKIDANKNGKVDAHDFKLLRKGKKVAEEVEELDEEGPPSSTGYTPSKAYMQTLKIKYHGKDKLTPKETQNMHKELKKHTFNAMKHIANSGIDHISTAAKNTIQKRFDPSFKTESSEWPVFKRIQEKTINYKISGVSDDPHEVTMKFADPNHVKGATKAEPMDDKWSEGEKKFVDMHGGLDGNESGVHGHKAAVHTAKAATMGVKAAPGRHNDSKIGDKTMPKPKG